MRPVYRDYYQSPGTREVCHDVKGGSGLKAQKEAMYTIASAFIRSGLIQEGDILIPAPQHTGSATYMREIAEMVAYSIKCRVCDILIRNDTAMLYGMSAEDKKKSLQMCLASDVPVSGRKFFIDNVIATGTTYRAAKSLIGNDLNALTYAVVINKEEKLCLKSLTARQSCLM